MVIVRRVSKIYSSSAVLLITPVLAFFLACNNAFCSQYANFSQTASAPNASELPPCHRALFPDAGKKSDSEKSKDCCKDHTPTPAALTAADIILKSSPALIVAIDVPQFVPMPRLDMKNVRMNAVPTSCPLGQPLHIVYRVLLI